MIYLDNAATTPLCEEAVKEQVFWACSNFYNPSATYVEAVKVSQALKEARERLKLVLGVKEGDVIFTSGATEANNLAVRGCCREGKSQYVFSSVEHASVNNLANQLLNECKDVRFVKTQKNGEIDYENLKDQLNEKTRLVSCMFVNNVTGVVNDVARISKFVRQYAPNALFHVDGVQAFCKLPFKLSSLDVDLFSISAHKFHGPKGVGALYVKNLAKLKPLVYGGGQESGLRSGTENVAGIMAMVKAAESVDVKKNFDKVLAMRNAFIDAVKSEGLTIVEGQNQSPYILTILCNGVNGETMVRMFENEVIVGRGSACSAKKAGNHVLEAMGFNQDLIKGAIRVSFDASLSESDVVKAGEIIKQKYAELVEKLK